jgi:hypothetical protein
MAVSSSSCLAEGGVVWCGCIVLDITYHVSKSPVAFVLIQFRKLSVIQR